MKELPFDMSEKVEALAQLISDGKERVAKACEELGYTNLYVTFEEGSNVNGTRDKPARLIDETEGVALARWWLDVDGHVMRFIVQPMCQAVAAKLSEVPE